VATFIPTWSNPVRASSKGALSLAVRVQADGETRPRLD
jgi:hypothetical protein